MRRFVPALCAIVAFALAASVSAAAQPVATYVGAYDNPGLWPTANQTIGPLHSDKIFYDPAEPLPATWPSDSYQLTPGTLAIIAYKVPTTNVVSFVKSIPASQQVTMVWFQEPEPHISASQFLSMFEQQANLIRSVGRSNVHVAMDAESYRYQPQFPSSYDCQYIPPASYVDAYYVDTYEPQAQGLASSAEFQRWLRCTQGRGRPLGIAEYGVGQCQGFAHRAATITADGAYLRKTLPGLQVLNYWWSNNSPNAGTGCDNSWQFTDSATIQAWRQLTISVG